MFKYTCLNAISEKGTALFGEDFEKTEDFNEADAVMVRSASMHEMVLPDCLEAIARAGAGVNNIPLEKCAEQGIVVFNTPGANANGVKELVLAGLLLASRDIIGGVSWVQSEKDSEDLGKKAEKEKKHFAGCELKGKKLGIIGLGAIGVLVANAAVNLDMEVYGYDPYISVDGAWKLSRDIHHIQDVNDIYRECDYITIHVPLLDSTKEMINEAALSQMKDGVVILNFARDLLVDEKAMVAALEQGKVKRYVVDFPTPAIAKTPGAIVIPHLGASTQESEDNCARMAAEELIDYMENGNIRHSVNYPDCEMGVCQEKCRIAINHRNIKNMIGQFTTLFGEADINIAKMLNKSKGNYAYSLFDLESHPSEAVLEGLKKINGVLKVRILK